jgi:hypothetical protein
VGKVEDKTATPPSNEKSTVIDKYYYTEITQSNITIKI